MYNFQILPNFDKNPSVLSLLADCYFYPNELDKFQKKINLIASDRFSQCYALFSTDEKAVGVIIIEEKENQTLIIKGIACELQLRKTGIGSLMVTAIIKEHHPQMIVAETDDESIGFYKKLGFSSQLIKNKYPKTNRYLCKLTL